MLDLDDFYVSRFRVAKCAHGKHCPRITILILHHGDKLDAFLASIREVAKIVEVARSGVVGLSRGDKIMR